MIIAETPNKWRCVFADKEYKKWDTIEICEYVTIPHDQIEILKKTIINAYWFWADWDRGDAVFLLWNGSLYNHSSKNPNMYSVFEWKTLRIGFVALKDIEYWDELVFDYGYTPPFQEIWNMKVVKQIKNSEIKEHIKV